MPAFRYIQEHLFYIHQHLDLTFCTIKLLQRFAEHLARFHFIYIGFHCITGFTGCNQQITAVDNPILITYFCWNHSYYTHWYFGIQVCVNILLG